jgi:hypothetical protein
MGAVAVALDKASAAARRIEAVAQAAAVAQVVVVAA